MTEEVYKLEDGEKTYENYYNAVKVAEAKAEEEGSSVRVFRKLLNTFEPVVEVSPDGDKTEL